LESRRESSVSDGDSGYREQGLMTHAGWNLLKIEARDQKIMSWWDLLKETQKERG